MKALITITAYVALFFYCLAASGQSFEFSQIRHIDLTDGTTRAHGAGVATLMAGQRSVLRGDAGELIQIVRDTVGIIERIIINEGRCTTILENEAPPIVIQDDVVILRGGMNLVFAAFIGGVIVSSLILWFSPWLADLQDYENEIRENEIRGNQDPVGYWDEDDLV